MREAINNNDIATSNMVAGASVAMLGAELVLGKTVFRDAEADFQGGHGSTVRIRVPKSIAPKKFEGSMDAIAQRITEQTVSLTLDTYAANPVDLTAEDMTLNVQDFTTQVVMPQTVGLAEYIEQTVASEFQKKIDTTTTTDGALVIDPATPRNAITSAGAVLDKARATGGARWLVVDPDIKKVLLDDPNLSQVADAGDSGDALREATIGKLYGFNVVMSPFIKGALAYTGHAYAVAIKAPSVPMGLVGKSVKDEHGQSYAMTWHMSYNPDSDKERSVCKTFIGVTEIDSVRSVGLKLKAS
ncbi:P22 phage major capsid protein family protein [Streptomyces albofaciens]|uniref:P22 phage major capsid protein family protein n=1 Tax=Streptomyces albofaciens TaxID=66866 RepID=UPI000A664D0E|nr:P22 phage major capsid protein family protein [Streptomyces albofaciens]